MKDHIKFIWYAVVSASNLLTGGRKEAGLPAIRPPYVETAMPEIFLTF
jgi:hypothetical protein